jgi:hypothetical protein
MPRASDEGAAKEQPERDQLDAMVAIVNGSRIAIDSEP